MIPRFSSMIFGLSSLVLVVGWGFFLSSSCVKVMAAPATFQESPELKQPWEIRAKPGPISGGLSTLSDASGKRTSAVIRRVLRVRSAFMPLFANIPFAVSEAPGLLVFSDTEEMLFTLRTRLAVSSIPETPALSFINESGQFIAVAVDQTNSLATDRALQASALEQMLVPLFENRLPPWARNGLLQYAASLHWRGARVASGELSSGLIEGLRSSRGNADLIPIERLLTLDASEWAYFESRGGALRMQANAWLLVHFLIHGEGGRLVPFFKGWLHAVAIGRDNDLDLAARLAPTFSLEAFEAARSSHLQNLVPGDIERFREQVEVLRILMQELDDSGIRPVDEKALRVELSLLAGRDIDLHQVPFSRTVRYPGIEFFDPCSITMIPSDFPARNTNDPSGGAAPMGLEFHHPSGESVRIEWIRTQAGWRSMVAW